METTGGLEGRRRLVEVNPDDVAAGKAWQSLFNVN